VHNFLIIVFAYGAREDGEELIFQIRLILERSKKTGAFFPTKTPFLGEMQSNLKYRAK